MDFESHGNNERSHIADMELGMDESERRPLVRDSHEFVNSIDNDLLEPPSSSAYESNFLITTSNNKDSFRRFVVHCISNAELFLTSSSSTYLHFISPLLVSILLSSLLVTEIILCIPDNRLVGILLLVSIAFGCIAFVGSGVIRSNQYRSEVAALEVTNGKGSPHVSALSPQAFDALKNGETAAIEAVTDVYVDGKMFSCSDEHVTGHCKYKNESILHEPRHTYGDYKNPIIYATDDFKYQIVEYKDESWMCPSQHISELSCTEGFTLRKACNKGEFNSEIVNPETKAVYFICDKCPVGHYQNDDKFMGTQCKNCPGGTWVDFRGAAEFDRCKRNEETKDQHAQDMPKEDEVPDATKPPILHIPDNNTAAEHKLLAATPKLESIGGVQRVATTVVNNAGTVVTAKEVDVKK